jgi:hypothetical protein
MPIAINEQIKILAELQKIDSQIFHLKKELAIQPAAQKRIEEDFEHKKAGFKAAETQLKSDQLKQKEREGELAAKEEKIKKLQGQLYALKTNKEYTAMDMEIKGAKADNSLLEEEILKLLDVVEESKSRLVGEKDKLADEEKVVKAELDTLKKKSGELAAQIADLQEKRKAYTPNIDPKLLTQYERILDKREGLAIVPVYHGACGGCHIGLTSQLQNEIQMSEKLITCEDCARMLYWVA